MYIFLFSIEIIYNILKFCGMKYLPFKLIYLWNFCEIESFLVHI